jgi:hypothetical protein
MVLIAIVACVEFLVAMAPVTGSDALHYHFTVQRHILEQGFHPIFSNSHSFLCGQHHLLILFGLSLGSEHLAMGFLFLGGILTVASFACLASQWASDRIVGAFSLLFLLTPVVFWQISASGSPDIFMAFLACTAAVALTQEESGRRKQQVILAGFLVGGVAGAKYTGCVIAAAFAATVALELRSISQLLLFILASLPSGMWPYLRNAVWTGNPVFPFLSARLSPHLATNYAVANLASDTGAASTHHVSQLIPFVFLAAAQKNSAGLWDFFGPIVLALAPLMLLAFRNTRSWRMLASVWFLSSLGIFFTSGLPRFLLPVFPIALSCGAAGLEAALRQKWAIAGRTAIVLLIATGLVGAVGLAMYAQRPVLAAIGVLNKTKYLEQSAQDYEVVEAMNRLLGSQGNQEKALVFVRHLYYLNVPYVNGDPGTSFEVDPEHLRRREEWNAFFVKKDIGYVVRSPNYPAAVAEPLAQMERNGDLVPIAGAEVENFQGKRIDEKHMTSQVVVLRVRR